MILTSILEQRPELRAMKRGREMKPSVSIVGCGKVGTTLAGYLTKAGYRIYGLSSRTLESAQNAAALCGATMITTTAADVTHDADMVFITTPDGMIRGVCEAISEAGGFSEKNMVFHCSGSLPSTILESAKKKRCCHRIHPSASKLCHPSGR